MQSFPVILATDIRLEPGNFLYLQKFIMRMIRYILLLLLVSVTAGAKADELSVIKRKYIESILCIHSDARLTTLMCQAPREEIVGDQMIVELMERYPIETSYIRNLMQELTAEGRWTDLDFANKSAGWTPRIHAARILQLAKVYRNPKHALHRAPEVAEAIHKALAYWFRMKPVSSNWWYNEIGIPKVLGAAFVLFEDQMTGQEKAGAFEVMDKAEIGMTAQNRVWLAGNVIVKGLLAGDMTLIREAREAINSEIKMAYGKAEGIKADFSFHQHGPQQQAGNYGAAFLATMSFWAYILDGTSLALEQDRFKIISDYVNKGVRRILWKNKMDVNNLGRQLYRQAQRHKAFSTLFSANALAQVNGADKDSYQALIDENLEETPVGLLGQYHFWKSDITIHRCPAWMASVRMASDRVIGTESGTDNVKGYYLADGALYTYVDGEEYTDIFPCWDWRKVPGVTCYQEDKPVHVMGWLEKQNKGAFVGNVNDGSVGITSMDLNRDGLYAKKSWIFTPDYVLCLGAGIHSDSSYQVNTTVEQALLREELLHLSKGKWSGVEECNFSGNKPERFFHHQTGYIVMEGRGRAFAEKRTGLWNDIMKIYPRSEQVTKDVYTLYFNHGVLPQDASYQYMILPATTPEQVKRFDLSSFRVISNTPGCQAVQIDKDTYLLAMYEKGRVSLSRKVEFESDKKGLFILRVHQDGWTVYASDPTQREETLSVVVNGEKRQIKLPAGELKGTTIRTEAGR